jgi:hypothetical protein
MSEVSDEVRKLAEKITIGLEYNAEDHSITGSKDLYESCIPEDLSMPVVKKVHSFDTDFVAAGALAFGTAALGHIKKDKTLDRVTGEIPMDGRNKAGFAMDRSKTYENRLGDGEKVTKFGEMHVSMEVRPGRNVGDLKAVKKELNELAATALRSK